MSTTRDGRGSSEERPVPFRPPSSNATQRFRLPLVGFPAVAMPTGVSDGLPVGVQLFAQRFREDLLLDAAEVVEGRAGLFTPIDPRNR